MKKEQQNFIVFAVPQNFKKRENIGSYFCVFAVRTFSQSECFPYASCGKTYCLLKIVR